ncbi:hypothetical protein BDW74DRAFT_185211 [Aspergillus multicolor]|uniref:uncharacterized protein n=1 Tax=Aspergillus multicolor TaxID=41759 RepID=UPI003CCD7031
MGLFCSGIPLHQSDMQHTGREQLQIKEPSMDSPSSNSRLKFRYWLPDASVNASTVAADIKSASSIGAGGIEFVPLYNYGASLAPPPDGADWATYGFGTQAYNEIFKEAMRAARDADMVFDFALGPNQGQGVPAHVGNKGLQWDLAPFNVSVPANGTYNGTIPGWGTGELVALVSAEVLSSSIVHNPASETFGTPSTTSKHLVLKSASLTDHTSQVQEYGTVSLNFNTTSTRNNSYHLFAYYQYQTRAKNLDIETNTTGTIFDNGSYTVDHFSARGAETTIDFWEKHILNDTETRQLLSQVGNYAWEDSLEIKSNISWNPSLPSLFRNITGYDIHKYLPLLQYGNNNPGVQPSYPGDLLCVLDAEDTGRGILNDFRRVLGEGYMSYLSALNTWAQSLGLEYSAQPSYNLPLDMESSIPSVSVPECESLAFNDNIDGYRQFSGPAHLAGQNVISNEMGGDLRKSFRLTLSKLIWQINSAFAGGVNQIVLHGQTYTGNYYDTTWPGYTAFFMLFSDSYNNKQPAWDVSYKGMIEYVSRVQWVLRQGKPRVDVAFLNKASVTDPQFATIYNGTDLVERGYTYGYISPGNLELDGARMEDDVLGSDGPGYRAMVVLKSQNVTRNAVRQLQSYAENGLPVILAGGLPEYYPSGNPSADSENEAAINEALAALQNTTNVHTTASESDDLAEMLDSLALSPLVSIQTNGTWHPIYRTGDSTETDYAFLFSDASSSPSDPTTGNITVQTTKTPYIFNAWTGTRSPLLHYTIDHDKGTLTIPVRLAANQTAIFAFSDNLAEDIDTPSTHATFIPKSVIQYTYTKENGLALHISTSSPSSKTTNRSVHFANGKTHALPSSADNTTSHGVDGTGGGPFALTNWTLTAEHWTAPTNFSAASITAKKYNTTHHIDGPSIPSWLEITRLKNVSGIGYYSTTFSWPPFQLPSMQMNNPSSLGAYLSIPPVTHGLQVAINGYWISGIDFSNPFVDIGPYLISGPNRVDIIVPTVMWNYIQSIYGDIQISGSDPLLTTTGGLPGNMETGLVGEVEVVPYLVSWVDI